MNTTLSSFVNYGKLQTGACSHVYFQKTKIPNALFGGNAVAVHAKASTLSSECSVSVSADYQARAEATLVSDTVV